MNSDVNLLKEQEPSSAKATSPPIPTVGKEEPAMQSSLIQVSLMQASLIEDKINAFKLTCTVSYDIKKNKVHPKEKLNCPCPPELIPRSVLRLQKEYNNKEITKEADGYRFYYTRKKLILYGLLNEPAKKKKKSREEYDERYMLKKRRKLQENEKEMTELRRFRQEMESKMKS